VAAVAVAAVAEAAVVAAAAADADAAAASSLAAAPAARPGVPAAGARPPRLIDAIIMAGFDRFDPGHAFFLVL
jgi:hypothetical protein